MNGAPRSPLSRRLAVGAFSVGLVALLGGLSRVPLSAPGASDAVLRLSWRFRAEEGAECRRPTPAELERLPIHMRNPEACVGDLPPYELHVTIDGDPRLSRLVRPAGVRGDRPIFVYEELRLAPGRYELSVRFGLGQGDGEPGRGTAGLALDTPVTLEAGGVLLVTRAGNGGLEARRPLR